VAGKKIEIIYRDDGGSNVELSKRAAQELIGREKVSFLIGFSLTPSALAVAPVATQGKVPMIVMNAVTTGITAKSPYMLRTSMTMQQMTEPFGTWTAQNKIGKVYSLVSDYSTGIDAEARFTKGFTEGGGKIVGSARVPLANPDYSPFVQRIKDEKPDALFFFAPGVEDGIGLLKAYSDKGLDKAGIKFLGVGDMTSDSPTLEALGDRALGAVTVLNYSTALDNDANKSFLKAYAAANPNSQAADFRDRGRVRHHGHDLRDHPQAERQGHRRRGRQDAVRHEVEQPARPDQHRSEDPRHRAEHVHPRSQEGQRQAGQPADRRPQGRDAGLSPRRSHAQSRRGFPAAAALRTSTLRLDLFSRRGDLTHDTL
jgi:hypothetical protein